MHFLIQISVYQRSNVKLINIPFVVITISTVLGIFLGCHLMIDSEIAILGLFTSICALWFFWHKANVIFSKSYSFSFLMIVVFVVFGITLVKIHDSKERSTHYSHFIDIESETNTIGMRFCIKERLKSTSYYHKYIVSAQYINNNVVTGKLLLKIPKDSISSTLDIGNTFTTYTKLKSIPKPLNPYQFDYADHLSKQYVFHQITVKPNQLIDNNTTEGSVFWVADNIRKAINLELKKYAFDQKQLSIINALLLGQRQDISQETFDEYKNAGAIHILAVSGLHVGILLMILNFVFMPLDRYLQKGRTIKLIITIALLWCFAIIAGLSPSVLRAVTMFSFIAVGMQIRSKTSIYNSLFISAFILLCFNPLLLFSIGFQLSYLAVFAIVWLQPIIAQQYHPRYFITKKLWETFTVTISAQLGLLPLTLFYFHQFPLLFFVSNLIIIPFLGAILGLGILVILLALTGLLPQSIATLFGLCIDFMNTSIHWIAQQDEFLITNIPFSRGMLMILYLVIISSILVFQKYEIKRVYGLVISILSMLLVLTSEKHTTLAKQELIIFSNQRNTSIGVLQDQQLKIYSKDSILKKTKDFLFGNYLVQNHADLENNSQLKNIYRYKEKTILIIDSSSIYSLKAFRPDIILLSNSPKIHLDRVIDSLHPKQIISDGSNYRSYVDAWEVSCRKKEIPFHRTDKKGAFILK